MFVDRSRDGQFGWRSDPAGDSSDRTIPPGADRRLDLRCGKNRYRHQAKGRIRCPSLYRGQSPYESGNRSARCFRFGLGPIGPAAIGRGATGPTDERHTIGMRPVSTHRAGCGLASDQPADGLPGTESKIVAADGMARKQKNLCRRCHGLIFPDRFAPDRAASPVVPRFTRRKGAIL